MSDAKDIIENREPRYGSFAVRSFYCERLKDSIHSTPNWQELTASKRVSLDMITEKLSRILCGNPDDIDSWQDIAGYAQLEVDVIGQKSESVD